MIDPNKVRKTPARLRSKHITIRITENLSNWLKKNGYSPTKIFGEAVRELGYERDKDYNRNYRNKRR